MVILLTYLCILPGSGLCIYGYRQKSVTLLLAGTAVLCVGLVIYLILSLMFSQTMFFLTDYQQISTSSPCLIAVARLWVATARRHRVPSGPAS